VGDELAALAVLERGGDADLDAELVRPMGLALADAFDFRRMQGMQRFSRTWSEADINWQAKPADSVENDS
jgi:hypothetical protein